MTILWVLFFMYCTLSFKSDLNSFQQPHVSFHFVHRSLQEGGEKISYLNGKVSRRERRGQFIFVAYLMLPLVFLEAWILYVLYYHYE